MKISHLFKRAFSYSRPSYSLPSNLIEPMANLTSQLFPEILVYYFSLGLFLSSYAISLLIDNFPNEIPEMGLNSFDAIYGVIRVLRNLQDLTPLVGTFNPIILRPLFPLFTQLIGFQGSFFNILIETVIGSQNTPIHDTYYNITRDWARSGTQTSQIYRIVREIYNLVATEDFEYEAYNSESDHSANYDTE